MPAYYHYLISSLPILQFNLKPALKTDRFIRVCSGLIPGKELGILKAVVEGKDLPQDMPSVLRRWFAFDTALRNALVKLRAGRKRKDPAGYIRKTDYWGLSVGHSAMSAYKNTSLAESEKILDSERWRFLDELSRGHYFDFDFLVVYALKLLILERWDKVEGADKEKLLEEVLN